MKLRTDKPSKAEKTALREWLKGKGVKHSDAHARAHVDDDTADRKMIASDVIAYCNALPKAK